MGKLILLAVILTTTTVSAACPAGKECTNGDKVTATADCATGSYNLGGYPTCRVCPPGKSNSIQNLIFLYLLGHKCANKTSAPVRCSAG
jgi:hypothetical protein